MERGIAVVMIFFSVLGACAVFAAGSYASITALGRNPSAAPKIFTAMVAALVFAAALSIIAMLIVFQLYTR